MNSRTRPAATLRNHLTELETELRRRTDLRDRLTDALSMLDHNPEPTADAAGTLMKVIESMTTFEQYVHGYRAAENSRLHDQADTLVDLLHHDIVYPAGSSVLEVGCGVGAQTEALALRNPGARITSVDISAESLGHAQQRLRTAGITGVTFRHADVYDLPTTPDATEPLPAASFDHIFVCFLLEHLPRPAEALSRLLRMLAPGGTITVIEGDHGSAYFHPDSAAAREVIACQVRLQAGAGGNAMIGRELHPLLVGAGYRSVQVQPRMVYVDGSRPELADGFIRKTFTAMIDGVRTAALAAGLIDPQRFDRGIADLERTAEPDGVFCYTFFRATATT